MADSDTKTESQDLGRHTTRAAGDPSDAPSDAAASLQSTKQTARREAQELMGDAKRRVQAIVGEQQRAAAGQISGLAQALRTTAEQLYAQDQGPMATYAERAADSLERFGNTLRNRDIDSLAAQVQDFARKQPGVFLGGAVAAGFLVARFLKSTSPSPSGESWSGADRYSQPDSTRESVGTPT